MNLLVLTQTGGMRFELDDLEFMDAGYREAFAGLASMLGDDVILSGLDATFPAAGVVQYDAGFVIMNGEVLKVEQSPQFDLVTFPYRYLELDITYDPNGLEAFEDGQVVNTYEVRKAKVVGYATAQTGKTLVTDFKTAATRLNELAYPAAEGWKDVGSGSGAPFGAGWSDNINMQFRKDVDGRVWLRGRAQNSSYTSGQELVFTLPVGYRPASILAGFLCPDTGTGVVKVVINDSGEVRIDVGGTSGSYLPYIDSIVFDTV